MQTAESVSSHKQLLYPEALYIFKPVVLLEVGVLLREQDLGIHSLVASGLFIHEQLLLFRANHA